ncbi:ABC transporter substrate binding protein [Azonexus sp.]|uniref:ABC transporter substrate binding protein n=1 Tax=Azonexus sp. TaxID=1872668 RepID=UPI0027BA2E8A|nr:ABC transporter substrate binding protein [Azonexus sp.]
MTPRFKHFLLALLLALGMVRAEADVTRIAVIFAEADDTSPSGFAGLLGGIEATPGVEVIRLSLKDLAEPRVSQLLLAAAQRGTPVRLAAAGGASIGPIAVLYPDIGEPYRSVFSKIIEGIEENAQAKVTSYAVGKNFNAEAISGELKRQDIRVVIALGRNGLKAASTLDKEIGVIAGGVVSVPEADARGGAILSLAPDPALLFSRLKVLSPKTQRVFVVFEPRQNAWLIKLAREAARHEGIELIAQEAADLKSALGIYQNIFANADARRDALWLPQDSATVDESLVLPLVLQESWSKSLPVFSSNVSHVKRGALFALYPNNMELGRNLAATALGLAVGNPAVRGLLPLRDVLTAFNTRTASHLGLALSPAQQQGFDLLFPER